MPLHCSGAQVVSMALEEAGTDMVFGMPGGHILELFDAFHDAGFATVLTTSELSAAFMADAYARATGRVGVSVCSPGPGLTYMLPGLAEALLDSSPVVALVAALDRRADRAFFMHALDQAALAAPVVKRFVSVKNFEQIPECIASAFALACAGEPGPVMVEIPVSVLRHRGARPASIAAPPHELPPVRQEQLEHIAGLIVNSRQCGVYAGKGAFGATEDLEFLCEHLSLPLCTTISGRGVLPEDHPLSLGFGFGPAGTPVARSVMGECDALLAVGCKFGEVATGGWDIRLPERLMHIDACPETLERNYKAAVALAMDARQALRGLREYVIGNNIPRRPGDQLRKRIQAEKQRQAGVPQRVASQEAVTPAFFFARLREKLPRDAVLVTDCGMHQFWALSHFQVLQKMSFVTPADFQSMGFCVPACVAVQRALPGKTVVGVCGDGGFLMTGFELLTAVRENLKPVIIVFNDGALGLIEKLQERTYCRTHAVRLRNPDYRQLAQAFGVDYMSIRHDGELDDRLENLLSGERPLLVEVNARYERLPGYVTARMKAGARGLRLRQKLTYGARIAYRTLRNALTVS